MTATGFGPMDTTGFYPMDTRADPDEIRRAANGLQSITGDLLGHGDAVGAVLSEVALSFSEVIAPAIAAQIGNNVATLEAAVEATEYGHVVGLDWAENVTDFKTARKALIARWEAAEMDHFGVPNVVIPRRRPPLTNDEVEQLYDDRRVAVVDARSVALEAFVREGHELWEGFQDRVIEKGRMFREGPTAENLALVVGHLGWGAMTLWPEFAPAPVSAADGVSDASTVIEGLDSTASPSTVIDALADVAAITKRAAAGQELTPAEIDYLEAFYETMGVRIVEVPDYLEQLSYTYTTSVPTSPTDGESPPTYSTHTVGPIEPALIVPMTAAAANGMLVLSRHGTGGGGYERLPTWVRETLHDEDSPYPSPVGPDPEDYESLLALGEFLGSSTVAAGDGLSRELALATQRMIVSIDGFEYFSPDGTTTWGEQVDAAGQSFLDVVARNESVSFDLITGSDMPQDYDAGKYFLDMYTFEWSDDGESAAGLTAFIARNSDSDVPTQRVMADQAMRALIDIVTEPGAEGFGTLMDGVGTSGDPAMSSLGQVNPAISAGLGSLMTAYLDDFGLPEGNPGALGALTIEDRARFTTLIMTDPTSGEDMVAAIDEHNNETMSGITDRPSTDEFGKSAGRLLGLVDAGAVNIVMDQLGDQLAGVEEEDRPSVIESVVNVTLGRLPGVGGAMAELLGELASGGTVEQIAWPNTDQLIAGDTEREYQLLVGLAQTLNENGRLPTGLDPRLFDGSGDFRDFGDLEMNGDRAFAELQIAIESALGVAPTQLHQALGAGYGEVASGFPASPDVYEGSTEG